MLYFNLLPNELMDLIFFKLKSDSVLLKDISDRYSIFLDNLNKGNYLPENVFRVLDLSIKNKMLKYIDEIKGNKFDVNYNNVDIENHEYIIDEKGKEKILYKSPPDYIIDIINTYVNNSKYIFLYHETSYKRESGHDTFYIAKTKNNEYVIINIYESNWVNVGSLDIYINKNFKYLWETILNKEEYNHLLTTNLYIIPDKNIYFIEEL
jgi:hypothetical protein